VCGARDGVGLELEGYYPSGHSRISFRKTIGSRP